MHRGYFPLYRKFQDHKFWREKRVFSKAEAWIDILWEVQHEDEIKQVVIGMTLFICNYGESLNSLRTWGKRWNWSISKIHRFFILLENMGQIRNTNETVTTRITVLNYRQYDPRFLKVERLQEHERNTIETQQEHYRATDKKVNTVKKVKKEKETCPHNEIVKLWNEKMVPLGSPRIQVWNDDRKKHLKARWDEVEERQNLDWWKRLFEFISKQDFLMGRIEPGSKYSKPFKLTFVRAIQSSNQLATITETGKIK